MRKSFCLFGCVAAAFTLSAWAGTGTNGVGTNGVGTNGVGTNGVGTNGVGTNGVGTNGTGTNGVGTNGTGSNGTGTNGVGTNGTGSNGTGTNGVGTNGTGSNGTGTNGVGTNGTGSNGVGTNGVGTNGVGTNGLTLGAVANSTIFGDVSTHSFLMGHPFNQATLTDPALAQVWSDPYSVLALSYLWADAHSAGDDLIFDPCAGGPTSCLVHLYGNLGLCDRGPGATPRGAVRDVNLGDDYTCQHLLSATFLAESNAYPIHNILSFAGPPAPDSLFPGQNVDRLTSAAPAVASFPYQYGSKIPVDAIFDTCDATTGLSGPVNCGWTPGFDGICTPNDFFSLTLHPGTNPTSTPLMVQANQGVYAHDYPYTPIGDCYNNPSCSVPADFLGAQVAPGLSGNEANASPWVIFQCPASGIFNLQWAPYTRTDYGVINAAQTLPQFDVAFARPGVGGAQVPSATYPADEIDVFPRGNAEAFWAGNIFGQNDLNPALTHDVDGLSCDARPAQQVLGAADTNIANSTSPQGPWGATSGNCRPDLGNACLPCIRGVTDVLYSKTALDGATHDVMQDGPAGLQQVIKNTTGQDFVVDRIILNGQFNSATLDNEVVVLSPTIAGETLDGLGVRGPTLVPSGDTLNGCVYGGRIPNNGYFLSSKTNTQFVAQNDIYLCAGNNCEVVVPVVGTPVSAKGCGPLVVPAGGTLGVSIFVPPSHQGACAGGSCLFRNQPVGNGVPPTLDSSTSPPFWTGAISGVGALGNQQLPFTPYLVLAGHPTSGASPLFPNAHVWLSGGWTGGEDYYLERSCSGDLSTCALRFEGLFSTPGTCGSLSTDVDSTPLAARQSAYSGPARPLYDVSQCLLAGGAPLLFTDAPGSGPYAGYGVTSFMTTYQGMVDTPVGADCNQQPLPTAAASGPSSVCGDGFSTFQLDASQSFGGENNPLTFGWTELSGAVPPLTGATPTVTAPLVANPGGTVLTFRVTATDLCGRAGAATVSVPVKYRNQAPVAESAPLSPFQGNAHFQLNSAGTYDPEKDPICLRWTQTGGPAIQPDGTAPDNRCGATFTAGGTFVSSAASPTLFAPDPTALGLSSYTLTFQLQAADQPASTACGSSLTSAPVTVTVTVEPATHPPLASAGADQTVLAGRVVVLSGSAATPDGFPIAQISWTQPAGQNVALTGAGTLRPTFMTPLPPPMSSEALTFTLVVTDSRGVVSAPATTHVLVQDPYAPPACGAATVKLGCEGHGCEDGLLWPPDHRLVKGRITGVTDPGVSSVFIKINSIFQDEWSCKSDDGDVPVDAVINPDGTFLLRAERVGWGDGRVYHVSYTASNLSGGSCTGEVDVCVPHDKRHACVDEGALYDSTRNLSICGGRDPDDRDDRGQCKLR